jgi:metallophosphoesterase (TIGR03767 family)
VGPGRSGGSIRVAACWVAVAGLWLTALLAAGCGGADGAPQLQPGSTLANTIVDTDRDGVLEPGPGAALVPRTDLAPAAAVARTLVTLAQISDLHVVDEESPLRVEVVDRTGGSVTSAFRPQEALTTQVVEAAVHSVNRLAPDAVLVTGDLADNTQENEVGWALTLLGGGEVNPDSGVPGYEGVQQTNTGDPFFYRPDLDAPRHIGLLSDAQTRFRATGLAAPWLPAVSNHDVLVQGVVPVDGVLAREARGARKLERPSAEARAVARDGVLDRDRLERLLIDDRLGLFRSVGADPARRLLGPQTVATVARAAAVPTLRDSLVYDREVASGVRVVVLDTANRSGGSDGELPAWQVEWMRQTLRTNQGDRFIVVAPTPLELTRGGDAALAALDATPGVVAVVSGDTHRNLITPRAGPSGGFWLVRAPSLVDFPQQVRALRLVELTDGRVALQTWLIDHAGVAGAPGPLGLAGISRELAFLDTQGGRPRGWSGQAADRNATLYLASAG